MDSDLVWAGLWFGLGVVSSALVTVAWIVALAYWGHEDPSEADWRGN